MRGFLYSKFHIPNSSHGFTLIEILIYTGIFAIVSSILIGILVTFTRIDATEQATSEVANQANFILQQVRRLTSGASAFEVKDISGQKELWLYPQAYTTAPTKITKVGSVIMLSENGAVSAPLTTAKVVVDNLVFSKYSNPPGPDVIQVDMTLSYNAATPAEAHTRTFRTAIARVSAATFDTDLVPSSDNFVDVGLMGARWKNGVFSGGIGIGVSAPTSPVRLEIDGGARLNTSMVKPTCGAGTRGTFWVTQNGAGVKDEVVVCAKDAGNAYAWRTIY